MKLHNTFHVVATTDLYDIVRIYRSVSSNRRWTHTASIFKEFIERVFPFFVSRCVIIYTPSIWLAQKPCENHAGLYVHILYHVVNIYIWKSVRVSDSVTQSLVIQNPVKSSVADYFRWLVLLNSYLYNINIICLIWSWTHGKRSIFIYTSQGGNYFTI